MLIFKIHFNIFCRIYSFMPPSPLGGVKRIMFLCASVCVCVCVRDLVSAMGRDRFSPDFFHWCILGQR